MNKELPSIYDPKQVEKDMYEIWEKSGYFNPDKLPARHKKPFTIIMPPPNANGSLHIGHALFVTIEDIMIRYQRMLGKKTLWLPGADHAGFETQVVYHKKIEKEKRSFWNIPREKLYKEIEEFTLSNKKYMEGQLKKLGASCDWSREKFTLDEDIKKIVYQTFKKMYDDGLTYRAEKPINWCTKHQTTLSDLEIKHEEKLDKLYYINYQIDGSNDFIEVATTRPETIPADIAIAVHPKSKWNKLIGKKVINPITKKKIPIISDMSVELDFGTGALKITPYHDQTDFTIWTNHKNEIKDMPFSVINRYGKMTEEAGVELEGLKIKDARIKSVELLESNLSREPEDYNHKVAVCYKCNTIIEPRVMLQWFIKMNEKPKNGQKSLRDIAVDAVKSKKIKFIPARFEKIFMHWMENLHDWNISRQIVWGIRMPIWYCQDMKNKKCKEKQGIIVDIKRPKKCPFCSSPKLKQEEDVFDTWFSSGQWPFASLMTNKKGDFEKFYPTDVMETGWDILFFWVARMIMFGIYTTGKIPFKNVFLHGLVRDKDRQKMSKSKNNVVNPLEIAEIYGTDAVRIALVVGSSAGNDPIISEDKIRGYRNFTTKIWNASRFVFMNYEKRKVKPKFTAKDKKNLKDLETTRKKISNYLDKYDFNHAAETAYHYFWHTFADKIIEQSKSRLKSENKADAFAAQEVLIKILIGSLKLLHPFMPFITEQIYQLNPATNKKSILMIEKW
ncbi:valine--tRNA ligase [Patescibacteria group bacterium]|nr:valine--tRNA ligase [Patescibacteria group bacterium]